MGGWRSRRAAAAHGYDVGVFVVTKKLGKKKKKMRVAGADVRVPLSNTPSPPYSRPLSFYIIFFSPFYGTRPFTLSRVCPCASSLPVNRAHACRI